LRGDTRKEVINEVNRKSTYLWKREKADEKMDYGDDEPADLPNEGTLRNAKYTEKRKELYLKSFSHPMLAVEDLKSNSKYSESLREICLNKMYTGDRVRQDFKSRILSNTLARLVKTLQPKFDQIICEEVRNRIVPEI
ncbi:hypothetical protein PV326_011078, partial [Microctonus aethiopoides]